MGVTDGPKILRRPMGWIHELEESRTPRAATDLNHGRERINGGGGSPRTNKEKVRQARTSQAPLTRGRSPPSRSPREEGERPSSCRI